MLYSEFLDGTKGIDCNANYNEFKKLERVYLLFDTMTKKDIYKQANIIKTSNTSSYVEFLAQILALEKSTKECYTKKYWFIIDYNSMLKTITKTVLKGIQEYQKSEHIILMPSSGFKPYEVCKEDIKKIARKLNIC